MMKDYLINTTADSFSGEVFAFEGIDRVITIINGPSGCKFYHSATVDNQTIKQLEFDPLNYPDEWYFGQPRVPCTYLDTKDYVYGSKDKLIKAINFLDENIDYDLLCVVNSPGAALIGDNLKKIVTDTCTKPNVCIESPGFSKTLSQGYQNACLEIIKQLEIKKTDDIKEINIIGLSIFHKYYIGDIQELKYMLGLCGIKINCFMCCSSDLEQLRKIPNVSLNVVIYPEYGTKLVEYLYQEFETPYYICDGPPIGFKASEKMIIDICNILGLDYQNFMVESEKARAKCFVNISRVNSLTGLPKGVYFGVEGSYSQLYAYGSYLSSYFGMIFESAIVLDKEDNHYQEKFEELVQNLKLENFLNYDLLKIKSELVFSSGSTIAKLKLNKNVFSGIEIALPSLGYIDVIDKTHLGLKGALLLTEQVLNGLLFH